MLYPASIRQHFKLHPSIWHSCIYFAAPCTALWDLQVHELAQVVTQKLIDRGFVLRLQVPAMEVKASQALSSSSGR